MLTYKESKELMNQVGQIATWSISSDGEIWWCDGLYKLYGMRVGDKVTIEAFKDKVYPNDYERFQDTLNSALKNKESFQLEVRVFIDNNYKWVQITGKVMPDKSILGVTQNIDHLYRDYHSLKQDMAIVKLMSSNPENSVSKIHNLLHNA